MPPEMYVNGVGLRAIERVKRIHTAIGLWVKLVSQADAHQKTLSQR